MLAEVAVCLAQDGSKLPDRYGLLTPVAAMGDVLVDRLNAAGTAQAHLLHWVFGVKERREGKRERERER